VAVFMYSPGVKIYISTQANGVLDISEDVTDGHMVRRSDGVSSFRFTLQNPRRKYDGVFCPNDRIIVMMKRVSWLRTFTGYLNAVPLVTAWPTSVQITASCSLKRLQYWFWDPGLAASQNMVAQALSAAKNPDDGGVSNAVLTILQNVVGWPAEKVHIAGIPQNWITWAYKIAQSVQADAAQADQLAQQFYATLGAGGTVGGTTGGGITVGSGALKAGTYGGVTLSASQAAIAVTIYNVAMQMGGSARDAIVGIMTAYQESKLANIDYGTGSSIGVFQQISSWGTTAQRLNVTWAAQQFFKVLLKISNRNSMSPDQEAQAVQRSAYPAAYGQWQTMATQVVNVLANGSGGSSVAASSGVSAVLSNGKAGKTSAASLLGVALGLVQSYPHIPYQEGGDSGPSTAANKITYLDCSSFVQWVIYHALGGLNGCPRTSQAQSSWCQSSGKIVSAQEGLNIPGALMFMGSPGAAPHVEISCGDGTHTVGAHHSGTYAGVVSSASIWVCAGLAPGVDYSAYNGKSPAFKVVPTGSALSSGGAAGAQTVTAQGLQTSTASSEPWYNPNDEFDKLFGNNPWFPIFDQEAAQESAVFTGPRALLNDQPLLPYLKNLFGSCMRSYCSAPNGDLIAWFPDYYGIWGTAAIMQIEPIELQDFTVYWDDTNLVTHQFTVAPPAQQIDLGSGTASGITVPTTGQTLPIDLIYAMTTSGIAGVDNPGIMYALFGLEPSEAQAQKFIDYIYNRFGARPDLEQLPGIIGPQGEFFSALFLFMRSWAYQYNADIPMTFMPELWPGMLIQIPSYSFQAYVTTVTHDFKLGPGGYFNTSVNIAAPARIPGPGNDSGGQLIGLPVAGGLTSGTNLPIPGQANGGS
jgi:hypothetical protein